MTMKKKYTTLDELNQAQKAMARESALIEDEFLSVVKNPLNIFSFGANKQDEDQATTSQHSANTQGIAKTNNTDNDGLEILQTALNVFGVNGILKLASNVLLPMIPTKKIGMSLVKNAGSIALKVIAVNIAIWGAKKIAQNIKKKAAKKKSAIRK